MVDTSIMNGALLKKLRLENGYKSHRDLAFEIYKKLGIKISWQSIENHEKSTHVPRGSTLMVYAKFFKVDPKRLCSM